MFKCLKTFAIGNDCVQRCYVHGENKFFLAGEIEIAENFSACVLSYDGKDLKPLKPRPVKKKKKKNRNLR